MIWRAVALLPSMHTNFVSFILLLIGFYLPAPVITSLKPILSVRQILCFPWNYYYLYGNGTWWISQCLSPQTGKFIQWSTTHQTWVSFLKHENSQIWEHSLWLNYFWKGKAIGTENKAMSGRDWNWKLKNLTQRRDEEEHFGMMVIQLYTSVKTHPIIHLKAFFVYKLYNVIT